jgi:polyketide synthase PksN
MKDWNKFLGKMLWGQLQSLGLFAEKHTTAADLSTKIGLIDLYERWLEESLTVLAGQGYLQYDGESYTVTDTAPMNTDALWNQWDEKKGPWLEAPNTKAQVVLVETTLRALPQILTGKRPATDIIFPNSSLELVEGIYKHNPVSDYFNEVLADTVAAYIQERLRQDSSARPRIIEIGAGTGGTSAVVFEKLQPYKAHIEDYCYTDISKAFLMHAENEYGPGNPYLTYQMFDVSQPIAGQNIHAGGYDIAIASNVLHATKNIRQTLRNTKATLKYNGLLLLNELSVNSLFTHLTFGLLEGWWLYEDPELRIPGCPSLSPRTWQEVLEHEGFRSVFFPAQEAHGLGQQIVAAESDGVVRQGGGTPALLDHAMGDLSVKNQKLQNPNYKGDGTPSLSGIPNYNVPNYKPNGLRASRQYHSYSSHSPISTPGVGVTDKMVEDYVRTIIRESIAETLKMAEERIQDDRSFSEIGVDSIIAVNLVNLINKQCKITLQTTVLFDYNNVDRLTQHIIREHQSTLIYSLQEKEPALEGTGIETRGEAIPATLEKQDHTYPNINRRMKKNRFQTRDMKLNSYQEPTIMENQPIYHRVVIERPGEVDNLKVIKSPVPGLKENEVRIAIRAFSLNFGDLLCVRGLYPTMPPYPFTPGFETSGVVVNVGSAVTSVQPGDPVIVVMGEALGGQSTLVTCPEEQVLPTPESLSFEEACALPVVALTMIVGFRNARLKQGEKILIQTAAGGTGLIAVQLAQHYGAEIYATAGSQHKLDYLKKLGVPHLVNYRETDFEKEIKRLTHGKGVDVVINTLAGDAIQKGMNCLSPGGRYIEIAMTALKSAKTIDLSVLNNNQTFYSVDLRKLGFEAPETIKEYSSEMIRLVEQGIIHPTVCRVFPLDQVKEAYHWLENRKNIGKIVVSIPEVYQFRETALLERVPGVTGNLMRHTSSQQDAIAIIGMSGRFAKSKTVNDLWEHLSKGTDLIEEVSRWDLSEYYPDFSREKKNYCNHGSFLEDIDRFDPLFFNISGLEATYMDPQQRFFLEECWTALEDAGYAGTGVEGRLCGVYVGCSGGDYRQLLVDNPPAQAFWGNAGAVIPARIAYYLDLQGPAVAIDTACSSSLVAIHFACQGLWGRETELALAGGVFIQSTHEFYLAANRAGMLSPTGHCHTFDQNADGFVPGEGVGVVVLKRLEEAIADGDHIYGVIRGSGINQDGTTNGITAPSANSQERLERFVYDTFHINPEQIQIVEAHGTGTKLGDPIEYGALTRAFAAFTDKKEYCAIGSIKTNLGHTATAAGIAGLIKVLLSLQHKQIPPSLHFHTGNANIRFKESPFYVNTGLKDWEVEPNSKRCAAISSFGFSGTNAHMVIEETPELVRKHTENPGYLIVLSARKFNQLQQQVKRLFEFCEREFPPGVDCGNMSYTLLLGRKHFNHRLACVVRTREELDKFLRKWLEKGKVLQVYVSESDTSNRREQPSLKRYGNQCIQHCLNSDSTSGYLEHLSTVADLFVQGYALEFERLFSNEGYSRISLPTYPFARGHYWVPTVDSKITGSSPTTSPAPREIPQPSLSRPSLDLQPITALKSNFSNKPDKPNEISLRNLSDSQTRLSKPGVQIPQSITLSPAASSLSIDPPGANDKSGPVTDFPGAFTAESLQEELISGMAELLFMDRSEVDPDKKFIELGVDSIIGVEWMGKLKGKYGITVPATKVYDYPTIREFAGFLEKELNQKNLQSPNDPMKTPSLQANVMPSTLSTAPAKVSTPQKITTREPVKVDALQSPISQESLQEDLVTSLTEILSIDRANVDPDKKFVEMGVNIQKGLILVKTINKRYGTSITTNHAKTYPTIREFAGFLKGELEVMAAVNPSPQAISIKETVANDKPIFQPREIVSTVSEYRSPSPGGKESIAIVGMSGRYPGARDLSQYWQNLAQAKNSIREIPGSRWDVNRYYDPRPAQRGKIYCKWLGLLEDIEYFDPLFFNISPTEAEVMDPQHRLFLQEGFKAFEDAGYSSQSLNEKKCGVYLGIMGNEYSMIVSGSQAEAANLTGNSFAIAAARIPYYLNLKGPAIPIDTACSSSLVATHLAGQALLNHEIDMALVGGVTLYLTPASYIGMCAAGMLSPDGQCKTFDNSADGFVPGEGVGTLVLKRLKDARADGDTIYGVIIASGINQDGKTNGITAPSVNSQIQLEREIYAKYNINPGSIRYVEMHGTGTKLGDPIELEALSTVFKERSAKKNYCAIGSVKSNIGHTSAAASVAGIQKVLLCMKHKRLVPTLNFKTPNQHYDFDDSPFYVNTEYKSWESAPGTPRRAGVSSFGFSGTNAHIIIEEYPHRGDSAAAPISINTTNPVLFILSARNETQLKIHAENMKSFIESHENLNLADMAYTLQVGRDAMNYRLALVADSREVLLKTLEEFIENKSSARVLTGQVKKSKKGMVVLEADEDANFLVQTWIQKNKLHKVAELWVNGLNLDWNKLYGASTPRRINLPTYPFARERYWVPEAKVQESEVGGRSSGFNGQVIHPLLHENTSDFSQQRFSSIFTGQEFFLADHLVQGQRVLPGVAYLEMARAAVARAAGPLGEGQAVMRLKNVVWVRPLAVGDEPARVHIGLFPEDGRNGAITYEIYSEPPALATAEQGETRVNPEPVLHSQGKAFLTPGAGFAGDPEVPALDLPALQAQCSLGTLSSSQCYETFKSMGLNYGTGHQAIEKVDLGPGQVLAKLSLPSSVSGSRDRFVLHPSLLDSALQASLGLMMIPGDSNPSGSTASPKPVLPFALQELEVFDNCTSDMWALIRYSNGSAAGDKVQKLDVDLCDQQGKICVRMKGFSSRVLDDGVGKVTQGKEGTLLLSPDWKEQAPGHEAEVTTPTYAQHLVILCEPEERGELGSWEAGKLGNSEVGFKMIVLQSQQEEIGQRFQNYTLRVFEEIQRIFKEKPKGKVLVQVVVSIQDEQQLFSGLSGLLKTARLENPKLIGQLIEVDHGEDSAGMMKKLDENSRCPMDNRVQYQNGKRWVFNWSEIEVSREEVSPPLPWKDRGIYLITGGVGGLGLIFAKEILRHVKDAVLILPDYSPLNEDKQARLKELETSGARIEYKQVDVTQKEAVSNLIQGIREEFGSLHGIIHGAGIIRDNFILKTNREELLEVLAPKVLGLVNLDQASKDLGLDFFVLFSSLAGCLGNVGQAGYSTANAFMDAYARYRNTLVASNQRQGQTLSINWPLWKEGGMHVDEANEKIMKQSLGIIPMKTSTGIRALYQGLASGIDQVMVTEGNLDQMKQKLLATAAPGTPAPQKNPAASPAAAKIDTGSLADKVEAAMLKLVSNLIKVRIQDIDTDAELQEYGFDSIIMTQLANQLNQEFQLELNPTAFFEHPTIHGFAQYLAEEHQAVLASKFGVQTGIETPGPAIAREAEETKINKRRYSRFVSTALSAARPDTTSLEPTPIAIIGMSGRFPMAGDLQEFWQNLAEGKDCITEIPGDRWDWREYWGNPAKEANKTNIKWGGFIKGVDEFDPLFFGISPREAMLMDPQQRLLMTYVWKAIEDAGYSAQSLWGTQTAIFAGTAVSGYGGLISRANAPIEGYTSTGMVPSVGPNRMSYFLNIHGPSEPIETACSSSLLAIHRAVEALHNGTCEMAIAGGVNTIVTPEAHISFNKAGMLSEDGRCKTFSDQANGYGRGEGVGMLFLKTLAAAEAAGDHIYGLIRATAVNHGGRANSLTAPNPNAQAELLKTAYTRAAIDPGTVTYIETHGTGTALGDPIEINGLKKAFQELRQAAGDTRPTNAYCGLATVKSNIGHLELAAGIAGVIKVLLQLEHKTLVKSLHCSTINPYIQLENSPFYILRETVPWKALPDSQGKDLPRRAGVSSFGFGGVNAHVVIEEYSPGPQERLPIPIPSPDPVIIVLSAKNETQLREQAQQLLAFLEQGQFPDTGLADMAYTLQVGRDAMEERLAMMVESVKTLKEKLQDFLKGREEIENLSRGQVKHHNDTLALFTSDEELQEAVEKWVQRRKWAKLLDLWVKGLNFDWNRLYDGNRPGKPQRISLPTYPFAREPYWISGLESEAGSPGPGLSASAPAAVLHPLLQQNTSDLARQRFSSTFTGREFFLADHVVKGQRVLPGVAYLEMARAAVARAASPWQEDRPGIRLKNATWIRPIAVGDQPVRVHIGLTPGENGEIGYEIYTQSEAVDTGPVLHSQGTAVLVSAAEAADTASLDLEALQTACSRGTLSSTQCYEAFRTAGIEYGPGHQGIETIYVGTGQVLARLSLPASVPAARHPFVLHPSLMDSALQASLGLILDAGEAVMPGSTVPPVSLTPRPALPFALQELEIFSHCTPTMWALVRYTEGSSAGDRVQKLDIDLSDETGKICVRMKGFSTRTLSGEVQTGSVSKTASPQASIEAPGEVKGITGTTMLTPVWDSIPLQRAQTFPAPAEQVVIIGGTRDRKRAIKQFYPGAQTPGIQAGDTIDTIAQKLEACGSIDHILWIAPYCALESLAADALIEEQEQGVLQLFRTIKALLGLGCGTRKLGWTVITTQTQALHGNDAVTPTHSSMHGLIGSMAREYPHWKVRFIDLAAGGNWPLTDISTLPPDPLGNAWVYRARQWYRQQLIPMHYPGSHDRRRQSKYRSEGVYVVIGGAGGIGAAWSEYMIRTYQARIIWIDRREKDAAIRTKLDSLSSPGPAPHYITTDASDQQALRQAYKEIKQRYSQIHGVIHSTIVLLDKSLANMEEERFKAGLEAKVDVSVRLAQVFQEEPLDFVLFFSSMISFIKTPGQSNYTSGCTFTDAFARQLSQEWPCAVKVMNWGYWGSLGIVSSNAYRERMSQAGFDSIEPPEAWEALETLLNTPLDQIALIKTTKTLTLEGVNPRESVTIYPQHLPADAPDIKKAPGVSDSTTGIDIDDLLAKVKAALTQAASQSLNVKTEDINAEAPWDEYGFDPMLVTGFINEFNRQFKLELNPIIFHEHSTLHNFAQYLVEEYREVFVKHFQPTIPTITGPGSDVGAKAATLPSSPGETGTVLKQDSQMQRILHLKAKMDLQMKDRNELFGKMLWGQLQTLGLFAEKHTTAADLSTKIGLIDLYERWLEESLTVLAGQGYLQYDGESCTVTDTTPMNMDSLWKEWDEKKGPWLNDPNTKAQVVLVETTLRALPQILTGKRPATDIIFPNSSLELVEGVYKHNPVVDYFNEMLVDTVAAYIQKRLRQDSSARLRILEIGAGTGGTSAVVFEKLQPYKDHLEEYCYTDISKAFLMHAEKEYGPGNPYLTYQIFDVGKPIAGQNIRAGGYDIAIAANVLHATKNIRQTLRNTKATLKNNGLLLLNELSGNSLFTHLTFGLLQGWWLYEDPELRIPGCPAISPGTWQEVLESEGFRSVSFPAQEVHDLGQQVVSAQSDGVVRQKHLFKTGDDKNKQKLLHVPHESRDSLAEDFYSPEGHPHSPHSPHSPAPTDQMLEDFVKKTIKEKLSESLKMNVNAIDVDKSFENYGIDSIIGVELIQVINQALMIQLETTILFNYSSISQLTTYMVSHHKDELMAALGQKVKPLEINHDSTPGNKEKQPIYSYPNRFSRRKILSKPGIMKKNQSTDSQQQDAIAIVGMSGRFPMASDVNEFWSNLREGKNCIKEIPGERWHWQDYYGDPGKDANKTGIKWGGFIDGVEEFDPLFFGISPREAQLMDPQQRLLMTYVWQAVEDAGLTVKTLSRHAAGVFIALNPWESMNIASTLQNDPLALSAVIPSMIPNRISYLFNLQGPSEYCETTCPSTLVALHRAIQAIHRHECEQAIVGAVNLLLSPKGFIGLESIGYLTPGGHTRPFQAGADGFIRSEGVGTMIIKPLQKAIENRDHIYAVIKGTSVFHGGKGMSLTAPNAAGMKTAMIRAYQAAGIDPRTVSYIEAHGIAAPMADGVEINTLKSGYRELAASFSQDSQKETPCYISSLKPCIGHGELVSGMAALIKVTQAIRHRIIPGVPRFTTLNEHISLEGSPFQITNQNQNWEPLTDNDGNILPRRASINSYGTTGVNAHVVLEEYIPPREETLPIRSTASPQIAVFSAKNPERLQAVVRQMLEFIEHEKELSFWDFVYTLQVGREAMESRLAMVVNNREELSQGMKEYLECVKEGKEAAASIPIFTGNLADLHAGIKNLLSGNTGEAVLQVILAENNLEKLAFHWTQGGKIPWESLHEGEGVRRISLPTYPFEKQLYSIEYQTAQESIVKQQRSLVKIKSAAETAPTSPDDLIVDIISGLLGMTPTAMNLNKPLQQYGFDSILSMQLLQQLQTRVDPAIDLDRLTGCTTVRDIINVLQPLYNEKQVIGRQQTGMPMTTTWPQFPELIRLNRGSTGRPVFWIHGVNGGVEVYQAIAKKIKRPFYGIQARGLMTRRSPLHGIQAIASYYIHMIQSVQPEGPYDLGGYSLGGMVAYEVTRQLQELGQEVDTIVMLDSIDSTGLKKTNVSDKTGILKEVNTALLSTIRQEPGKIPQTLIHREEVDSNAAVEAFLKQLITLAKSRGLNKTGAQLRTLIRQNVKIQQAYEIGNYIALPLPDPQAVTCYYFRNKSGLFLGELEPYFTITTDEISFDHTNYWEEWEQQFPKFHMMEVDSSNHIMLLSDPKVYETITAFCESLYSEKGFSTEFLKSSPGKIKKIQKKKGVSTAAKKATKKAAGRKTKKTSGGSS